LTRAFALVVVELQQHDDVGQQQAGQRQAGRVVQLGSILQNFTSAERRINFRSKILDNCPPKKKKNIFEFI
jgi:hypothetical protein